MDSAAIGYADMAHTCDDEAYMHTMYSHVISCLCGTAAIFTAVANKLVRALG